jgi:hypothetical protein
MWYEEGGKWCVRMRMGQSEREGAEGGPSSVTEVCGVGGANRGGEQVERVLVTGGIGWRREGGDDGRSENERERVGRG